VIVPDIQKTFSFIDHWGATTTGQRWLILLSYEHAIAVYQRDIELSVDDELGDYGSQAQLHV